MRMWLVRVETLCDSHLRGEHYEMHKLAGSLKKGRSIQGYLDKGQLEPVLLYERHDELAKEMVRRGMRHVKPIPEVDVSDWPLGFVNKKLADQDLRARCVACRKRVRASK